MASPGVIYSDFDGVYNIPSRPGLHSAKIATAGSRAFREETTIFWDREVFELFGEFLKASGFEFQWLTTWNEHSLIRQAAREMDFEHSNHPSVKLNHEAKGSKQWTAWKAGHIISDQRSNPRPFIWIDDRAPLFWREVVESSTAAPSLIIAPDSTSGIGKEEILEMVLWLDSVRTKH